MARRAFRLLAIAAAFLGVPSGLAGAVPADFTATLELEIDAGPPLVIGPLSGQLEANPGGSVELPGGVFDIQAVQTVPGSPFLASLAIGAANRPGTFAARGATGFGGPLGFLGTLRFGLTNLPLSDPTLPFSLGTPTIATAFTFTPTNGATATFFADALFLSFTTLPTIVFGTLPGGTPATRTVTGSRQTTLTPDGLASRNIQLVTPVSIVISATDGASSVDREIPGVGRLHLEFVPEPSRLLLHAAGVAAALALALRLRARRSAGRPADAGAPSRSERRRE